MSLLQILSQRPTLFLLAGGMGTRLIQAVPDVPKPLAPVSGRPFLRYLVDQFFSQHVANIVLLVQYRSELLNEFARCCQNEGLSVTTITEPFALGTGGAITYGLRKTAYSGPFLLGNADTWLQGGVQQVWASPSPTVATVRVRDTDRYGRVVSQKGKVTGFSEKRQSGAGWINAGLYKFDSKQFSGYEIRPFSLEAEVLPRLVAAGNLYETRLDTSFIDIGVPEDYFRFCRWVSCGGVGNLCN